jgi:hypothetical protein
MPAKRRTKLVSLPTPARPAVVHLLRDGIALPMMHEQCAVIEDGDIVLSVLEIGVLHEGDVCVCGVRLTEHPGQREREVVEQLQLWAS